MAPPRHPEEPLLPATPNPADLLIMQAEREQRREVSRTIARAIATWVMGALTAAVLVGGFLLSSNATANLVNEARNVSKQNQQIMCNVEKRQWVMFHPYTDFPSASPTDACGLSVSELQRTIRQITPDTPPPVVPHTAPVVPHGS